MHAFLCSPHSEDSFPLPELETPDLHFVVLAEVIVAQPVEFAAEADFPHTCVTRIG